VAKKNDDTLLNSKTVTIISARVVMAEPLAVLEKATGKRDAKGADDRRAAALVPRFSEDVTDITLDAFQANIANTTDALSSIFSTAFDKEFGEFQLNDVEVNLEISADGKVGFMGTGVGIKGSSSLKLKFERKKT
jgi:hypothetical protein